METKMNRRRFFKTTSVIGGSLLLTPTFTIAQSLQSGVKPALLGGEKVHPDKFQSWPIYGLEEEHSLVDVLRTGKWGRLDGGNATFSFEKEYAKILGAKHSLGVSSGTSALYTMLGVLDVGPEDEVIIPVYTFIATYNVVTLNYALPRIVDIDIETFQIDPKKIDSSITKQTKVIMPVHIGGLPADLDAILEIGKSRNIPVIEDACQAHLAEWDGKKVGTFGLGGAFSFQSSKNLNCAEGGAISSNDEQFIQSCYAFHNQGQGGTGTSFAVGGSGTRSTNLRLTEFQSALLLAQMKRLNDQAALRYKNGMYLNSLLNDIDGIYPAKLYDKVTMGAFHLYMFRYDSTCFSNLSLDKFVAALNAEGIPCSTGYGAMNKSEYVCGLAENPHYVKIYGKKKMKEWLESNECPVNDQLIKQAVWIPQNILLGSRNEMEQIAFAIKKIQKFSKELNK